MTSTAGLWDGLNDAEVFETGIYFSNKEGIYDVEIVRCVEKDTQRSGLAFIVETEVLTSTQPEDPAGSRRTWFQSMKNKKIGQGAVAGFLLALFGLENNSSRKTDFFPFLQRLMPRVTGPENVLSGFVIHLETNLIKTREKGEDFTRHNWSPFDFEEARRLGIDLQPPKWADHTRALPPAGYGAPPPPTASAAWQRTADGLHVLNPATNAWEPVSVRMPPPPPPPPSRGPNPWEVPGVHISDDRRWYCVPGTQVWCPIPGR